MKPQHLSRPIAAIPLYLPAHAQCQKLDLDGADRLHLHGHQDNPGHATGIAPTSAERKIPLHLISRITCTDRAQISGALLLECLRRGIPIAITMPQGEPIGWCLGSRRTETSLHSLLRLALDHPDWPLHYQPWLGHQHAAIASHVMLLCQVRTTPKARRQPRAALCNAHKRKHGSACAPALTALSQLASQEMVAQLAKESADPSLLCWHRPGLNILEDLGRLLSLYAHIDLHHAPMTPDQQERAQLQSWAIRNYERHSAHWQQRIAHISYAFEQFLRQHWL